MLRILAIIAIVFGTPLPGTPLLGTLAWSEEIAPGVLRTPGAQSVTIKDVGHFVQEEVGPELAALINDFIAGRPVKGF